MLLVLEKEDASTFEQLLQKFRLMDILEVLPFLVGVNFHHVNFSLLGSRSREKLINMHLVVHLYRYMRIAFWDVNSAT